MMKLVIDVLENNEAPRLLTRGEPFMSKHGLYPTTSTKSSGRDVRDLMNVLAYMDGKRDLVEIGQLTGTKISWLIETVKQLKSLGIVT
jgi:aminopeptidase-like protein